MSSPIRTWFKRYPLVTFFILTYVIAWTILIPLGVFLPHLLTNPVILIGGWSPTISAIILTGLTSGKAGVRELLRRGLRWWVGIHWYLVVFFGIAIIGAGAIALNVLLGGTVPQLNLPTGVPSEPLYVIIPILFLSNIFIGGPIAEEFGWRGFALPRLQARIGALFAGLVIGVIWGLWHLPFFIFSEGAPVVGNLPFLWFLLLAVAWSVLFTWVYNNTKGSVLMMILFHTAINTTLGSLGLFQITSEGTRPLILNVMLTWIVVAIVVAVFGPTCLARTRKSK